MAGEGSIFRRKDGQWVAAISIGGRADRRYERRIRRTRAEAVAALEEMKADRRTGTAVSKLSLGSYLRSWLDDSARPTISENTYRGYEDVMAHLDPIAEVPIAQLTAEQIERCCNAMVTRRGKTPRPLSPKTVRNAQVLLRRALGQAHLRGHVRRNVALEVPLRRVPRQRRTAITPLDARRVLAAVAGDRYEAAYALAMMGLREGEVLGLSWDDVDLDRGTVTVMHELVGSGPRAARHQLKTRASEATIPIPPFVVDRLRAHQERQRGERPVAPLHGALVFVTERGYAVNGSWLTKHFQALLERAGLPRMRIHDLRHGAATLLVGAGVHPRVAQQLLRHATSKTTMDIYSHVSAAQEREAADVLDQLLGESRGDSPDGRASLGIGGLDGHS